ncbi:hypothetical protein [Xanthomonas albilineans]|uniref:hypothetical protein n=1 Tax=Xanthomonas albilineans TaxID=29447 RepID=UPI000ACB3211|nr:hypothetical protein [Xanthomonas albilineans]
MPVDERPAHTADTQARAMAYATQAIVNRPVFSRNLSAMENGKLEGVHEQQA